MGSEHRNFGFAFAVELIEAVSQHHVLVVPPWPLKCPLHKCLTSCSHFTTSLKIPGTLHITGLTTLKQTVFADKMCWNYREIYIRTSLLTCIDSCHYGHLICLLAGKFLCCFSSIQVLKIVIVMSCISDYCCRCRWPVIYYIPHYGTPSFTTIFLWYLFCILELYLWCEWYESDIIQK